MRRLLSLSNIFPVRLPKDLEATGISKQERVPALSCTPATHVTTLRLHTSNRPLSGKAMCLSLEAVVSLSQSWTK